MIFKLLGVSWSGATPSFRRTLAKKSFRGNLKPSAISGWAGTMKNLSFLVTMSPIFLFSPGIISLKGPSTTLGGTLDILSMTNIEFNFKSWVTHVSSTFLMFLINSFPYVLNKLFFPASDLPFTVNPMFVVDHYLTTTRWHRNLRKRKNVYLKMVGSNFWK